MPRKKKIKYGVSALAWLKLTPQLIDKPRLRHIAFIVEAYNQAEAYGIATALAHKAYPVESYENHSVVTTRDDEICKIETYDGKITEFTIS